MALCLKAKIIQMQVHYRAPPDARGSGKERGHGCELQQCPKCEKELKQGRHHVGCFANKGGNTKKRPQKVVLTSFPCFLVGVRVARVSRCQCYNAFFKLAGSVFALPEQCTRTQRAR